MDEVVYYTIKNIDYPLIFGAGLGIYIVLVVMDVVHFICDNLMRRK